MTSGGNVTTNIQYKDTGVNLQVTPSVSAENIVTMSINQAVTDVAQIDAATGQRSFLQRQIISKVAVRSGETLVLGGLIRDDAPPASRACRTCRHSHRRRAVRHPDTFLSAHRTAGRHHAPRGPLDIDAREVGAELRERMNSFPGNGMIPRP